VLCKIIGSEVRFIRNAIDADAKMVGNESAHIVGGNGRRRLGKPIVDARDKRLKALQAAEQNRIVAARTALNDAASALRSISRGQWPVWPYCWFARRCVLDFQPPTLPRRIQL
jgi:hypothetical protein